jgi:hypothetical protein
LNFELWAQSSKFNGPKSKVQRFNGQSANVKTAKH